MKETISGLEKNRWQGVDVNLNISLFEYGIAWKEYQRKGKNFNSGDIVFFYGIGGDMVDGEYVYNEFDWAYFPKDTKFDEEFNWVEKAQLCEFMGLTTEEFDDASLVEKILVAYEYYGNENVFGTNYGSGFTIGNRFD